MDKFQEEINQKVSNYLFKKMPNINDLVSNFLGERADETILKIIKNFLETDPANVNQASIFRDITDEIFNHQKPHT